MSVTLRTILILVSVMTWAWILIRIRKAQMKIEDSIFWFLFSAVLVLMGVFPGIVSMGAEILGVQASVNFVFLSIIFILIVKLFRVCVRVSQLESKVQAFAQQYALDHVETQKHEPSFELDK